jgi:peptidylprolyl isomerase
VRRTFLKRPAVAAAVVLFGATMTLTACGSDDSTDSTATPEPSASSTSSTNSSAVSGDAAKAPKVTGDFGQKPVIAKPAGEPPTTLVVKDLKVGEGEPVTDTSKSYLWNYAGVSWSDGQTFDSSFDRNEAIAFSLDQVIPGWKEGLIGIKPGGRRLLVIPPDQAYGAAGSPPAIGPNETLVFVVDLIGPAS